MKPTGQRWHLHDAQQLDHFMQWVHGCWDNGNKPTIQVMTADRSDNQNAMIYALYGQISGQSDDKSSMDIRRLCKLHYGIGILKTGDSDFAENYDRAIKPMSYENKILLMGHMDVTGLFTKAQASEYIDTILAEYGRQGYSLVDPRDA